MKILVTGATGYLGRRLVKELINTEHDIVLLVKDKPKAIELFVNIRSAIRIIDTSDTNWKNFVKEVSPDVVIHLAAYLTSADDNIAIQKLIESNILFGTHLLHALKDTPLKIFINTGTFAEYL